MERDNLIKVWSEFLLRVKGNLISRFSSINGFYYFSESKKFNSGNLRLFLGFVLIPLGLSGQMNKEVKYPFQTAKPVDSSGIENLALQYFGQYASDLDFGNSLGNSLKLNSLNFKSVYRDSDDLHFHYILKNAFLYITALPQLDKNPNALLPFDNDDSNTLMALWDKAIQDLSKRRGDKAYLQKLNDYSYQVLELYLGRIYRKCHHSYTENEKRSFRKNSQEYVNILMDIQKLSVFKGPAHFKNYVSRLKLFHNPDSLDPNRLERGQEALDYPEIILSLYIPRWNLYRDYIQDLLDNRKKINRVLINEKMRNWERIWLNSPPMRIKKPSSSGKEWEDTLLSIYKKYQGINFRIE
jgi:hypothetical protein